MPRAAIRAYSQLILNTSGLVGYWKMNQTSGNITDSSTQANNGTQAGTPTYSRPQIVTGDPTATTTIQTRGNSSNYFNLGQPNILKFTTSFSVEGWVNILDQANTSPIIGRGNTSDVTIRGAWDLLANASGNRRARFSTCVGTSTEGTINSSTVSPGVHYLAGTWDGTTMRLYVDGTLNGSVAQSGTLVNPATYDITIGATLSNALTPGGGSVETAHVALYTSVLTAAQIAQRYQTGVSLLRTLAVARSLAAVRTTAAVRTPVT